ncbi:MAG: FG-GAP repeat protein [Verrucomicrobia bacterium]|nr:FG-GAP repeat protein [Verrucomicrobiota bacterium]MBU1735962.1 FG-GAP repeat protein [Verrucomicrobiota bacterium]MBU1855626.1 FG-GAP repeat protein [Verrucomicrobiota bacterium]
MKTAVVLTCLLAALTISAQELQYAPDNPAFLKYQQERIQKAAAMKTVDGHGLGYIPSPVDFSYLKGRTPAHTRALRALPSSYDLRTQGKLTPIKDQDPYGTCWAFATYSSLESTLMPAEERYFSVNNMANNHGFDYLYNNGGDAVMSTAYLTRWSGPINEVDDPYTNGPGHSPANLTVQKHVQEVLFLSLKASALDNTTIKQAVVNYGAMYVSMCSDFTNLYYNSTNFSFYYYGTSNSDHAVAIVGWDDNYAATNFVQTPAGNGAFIVRNSWGTNWGDNGYFYCSYYDSKMGYDENATFNNAEAVTNYNSVYQYDPLGMVGKTGYSSTNAWGANIFTATNSGTLRGVGFYATDIDMHYKIYIYRNITAGSPRSGTLELTQTGTFAYSGYHTVALNTPVTFASGQLFSVVIEFVNSSYTYPVAYEYARPGYSSRATSAPGQSYTSADGTSWSDMTTDDPTANVCIKAYAAYVRTVVGDYDGDCKSDLAAYREGYWSIYSLVNGMILLNGGAWGGSGWTTVPGDYDGDGKADLAVYNAGYWSIYSLVNGLILINGGAWGGSDSIPVPGDYDGDGMSDLAVYNAGYWSIYSLANGLILINGGAWGDTDSIPVSGDYDGDGKSDLAVYNAGYWSIYSLANGMILLNGGAWGDADSIPVPGDYDGDGKADLAVYNAGYWSIYSLANGLILINGGAWGDADSIPVPGDYDGDGKSDLAFYRAGYWSIYSLANGIILNNGGAWGGPDWTPVR